MTRKTIEPWKKKKPRKALTPLTTTQFVLERVVKRVEALEKQCDGLAKLDKEKDIAISLMQVQLKRFEKKLYAGDVE